MDNQPVQGQSISVPQTPASPTQIPPSPPIQTAPIQPQTPPAAPKSRKKMLLLLLVVLLIIVAVVITISVLKKKKGVITKVGDREITKGDLINFDRIYNGINRYQQQASSEAKVVPEEKVLEELIEQTLIENEAKKRNIKVTQEEINSRKNPDASQLLSLYGWTENDYEQSIKNQILREKLEDAITSWREFEYVTARFDLLPTQNPDISYLKPLVQKFLEAEKTDFANNNKTASQVAADLKANNDFMKDFYKDAIQFRELPNDPVSRRQTRAGAKGDQTVDNHVLTLPFPTTEIWCTDAACYLIKITSGNNGEYKTLGEWLQKIK